MKSTRSLWLVLCCLTLNTCRPPHQDRLTAQALRHLCTATVFSATTVDVYDETVPLFPLVALYGHFTDEPMDGPALAMLAETETQLQQAFQNERVIPPSGDDSCEWNPQHDREPYGESLLVEVSGLVASGTARNPTDGIFVRVSLGGRPGGTIFWIPCTRTSQGWLLGTPAALSVDDG